MIAHISPASTHFEESRTTLLYAYRAKNIKTRVRPPLVPHLLPHWPILTPGSLWSLPPTPGLLAALGLWPPDSSLCRHLYGASPGGSHLKSLYLTCKDPFPK